MFKILISNGITALFNDTGIDGIDNNSMIGFLINTDGIKELVESIPVSNYYINDFKNSKRKITKQQAFMLYDEIIKNQNMKEKIKK